MKRVQLVGNLVAGALLALAATSVAHAQATRTWVSGVGDDANPCSRTAPCKTFAGAISKTAAKGEINCLDPGGFGGVTITKSITIDCDGVVAGIVVSGTNAIVVNAAATDVVSLRNLDLNGLGTGLTGINVLQAKALHVEGVRIYGFTVDGIAVAAVGQTIAAEIHNTRIFNNTNAGNTTSGLRAKNGANVVVRDCEITQNSAAGIVQSNLAANGSIVTVSGSTIAFNSTALQSVAGAFIGSFGNTFSNNGTVFNVGGGTMCTGGDNLAFGNGVIGVANCGGTGNVPKI